MPAALTILLGGVNITTSVDMSSLTMQLAGGQEVATCEFDIVDMTNTIVASDEATLSVTEVSSATVLFGGFVRSRSVVVITLGRIIHVQAVDYNSLLDRSVVVSDKRVAGESDHARLVYLMTTYGTQFSSDYTQIATLNGSMPAQKFVAVTLRQAIEQVLGQASQKSSYYADPTGRLHTYDRSVVTAAPFALRVGTPAGGELAPETFEIDNDASNLANAIYIVGATAAGSGWFTDVTSIATYGRRERFFNAPDADTHAKASQVGLAVLEDQKDPVPRGVFTTQSPKDGWRIGQSITITSPQHGLAAAVYRIARVTVKYLNSVGDRDYTIEVGAPLRSLTTLLASAHGGGGAFPWKSPGGSGSWGPVVGSGETGGSVSGGGGCACNTPYNCGDIYQFDNFNRLAAPSSLGANDHGVVWTNDFVSGATWGCDGTQLFATGAVLGLYNADAAGYQGDFILRSRVRFAGTVANTFLLYRLESNAGVTADYAWIEVGTNGGPGPYVRRVSQIGADSYGASDSFTWAGAGIYHLIKWDSTQGIKVWAETATEPVSYLPHTPLHTPLPAFLRERMYMIVNAGSTINIDYINFESCPTPNLGQPYPWTNLGPGNGARSSWTTSTPFAPGSLEVRVDSMYATPISSTPTTGVFTLGFAPSSVESVWARWVVA